MPDYVQCSNKLPLASIIKAIIGEDAANLIHVKIVKVTGTTNTPIDCATYEEFINLFKQAIDLSVAGVVALRVIETTNSGADNVVQAARCAQYEDWWRVLSRAFYLDTDGQVALRIMDTT